MKGKNITELMQIRAIGYLLAEYHADLNYISNFQKYRNGDSIYQKSEFINKGNGTFKQFINVWKVARNFKKNETGELLDLTIKYIKTTKRDDVNGFAEVIKQKNISDGKLTVSLASKILFLNNPMNVLPMDTLVRKALNIDSNDHNKYMKAIKEFKKRYKSEIRNCLSIAQPHLEKIDREFQNGELGNINSIRLNRLIDKLIWVCGNNDIVVYPF